MATVGLNDYLYELKEHWVGTPPSEMWDEAGELCMMLEKKVRTDWSGTGDAKLPARDKLSGNVGPNATRAFASVSSGGVQYLVSARDNYAFMNLSDDSLEFGVANGTASSQDIVTTEAKLTATALMRVKSYLLWGDGTGRISKGNGAYNIAGTVITFLNRASVEQFEREDTLVFIDEGAAVPPSGMPAYRALAVPEVFPTVTAVDAESGTITVSVAITTTIPTAVNTDYIGKAVFFDGNRGLLDGVFRWIPITRTEALTTWAGVDRSLDVSRRSGRRVVLTGGESPYQIIGLMGEALKNARGGLKPSDKYYIFVPSNQISDLTDEAASNGLRFTSEPSASSTKNLTMGIQAVYAAWPGLGNVGIVCDHRLHDPASTEADDRTYALLNMQDWHVGMSQTGLTWKSYGDQKSLLRHRTDDPTVWYGQYGYKGDLFCNNPGHQVIASKRAGD